VVHEDVTTAWERVTEQWDDTARHEAFIASVAQHNCYAWAAARYKERAGDAVADKQLARLRKAATATMMAAAMARPSKERQPYRGLVVVLICLVLAMIVALFVTKSLHDNRPLTRPDTKPARH
jgi:hypothetical protein